jgi:hypothetical protein
MYNAVDVKIHVFLNLALDPGVVSFTPKPLYPPPPKEPLIISIVQGAGQFPEAVL